jgi:hypothetical protein
MKTTVKLVLIVVAAVIPFLTLPAAEGPAPSVQTITYQEDFEDGQAQDWTLESGWQVIQVEGNYVLAGQGHSWARYAKLYDDYRLSFRLMLVKGGVHLNFRLNDTGRYFIGFTAQGSQLSKQYWPDTFHCRESYPPGE